MRLYRGQCTRADGRIQKTATWSIDFRDHQGIRRRVAAFKDKRSSEQLGQLLERLADVRRVGIEPSAEDSERIEGLPDKLLTRLSEWGLVSRRRVRARKPLGEHFADYLDSLRHNDLNTRHIATVKQQVSAILSHGKWSRVADIEPDTVARFLAKRRNAGELSATTSNHYLKHFRAFLNWMVDQKRATANPVASLKKINEEPDRRLLRASLLPAQVATLISETRKAPTRWNMAGKERAMLYRLAIEHGLRSGELRSLTVESFDLDATPPTVTLRAGCSKHRRQDVQPLRSDTAAAALRSLFASKHPASQAFKMPHRANCASMLRDDLADAGIPATVKHAGVVHRVDFHALRHTCGGLMRRAGVGRQDAKGRMRHSDAKLTEDIYQQLELQHEADVIEAMPSIDPDYVATSA